VPIEKLPVTSPAMVYSCQGLELAFAAVKLVDAVDDFSHHRMIFSVEKVRS